MSTAVRTQLKAAGLGHLYPILRPGFKPSIRLTVGKASAQPASRLGGKPNLPKDVAWPTRGEGGPPLAFIAQFDVAGLPALRELKLPRKGSLYFFYDAAEQPWGFDPKDRGAWAVIYDPAPLADHKPRAWPADLDAEEGRFRPLSLTAHMEDSPPGMDILRGAAVAEDDRMAYFDWIHPLRPSLHRMGGNANEIQSDLHEEAQLVSHGYFCGDARGYNKARKDRFDASGGDWLLLLQVDSEDGTGMMFGDMGRLYFMIRREDLVQRRFDRVWTILQCT